MAVFNQSAVVMAWLSKLHTFPIYTNFGLGYITYAEKNTKIIVAIKINFGVTVKLTLPYSILVTPSKNY